SANERCNAASWARSERISTSACPGARARGSAVDASRAAAGSESLHVSTARSASSSSPSASANGGGEVGESTSGGAPAASSTAAGRGRIKRLVKQIKLGISLERRIVQGDFLDRQVIRFDDIFHRQGIVRDTGGLGRHAEQPPHPLAQNFGIHRLGNILVRPSL